MAWYNPFSWFGGDDTSSDSLGSTQMETFYDSEGSYQYYETDPVTPSSGSDGFWNGIGNFFGGFFNSSNDTSSDNQAVGWVSQIHQRHALLEDFGVAPSSERLQAGRDLGQSIVTGTELLADLTGVNTATILGSGQTVTGQDPTALDALAVIPPLRVVKPASNVVKSSGRLAKGVNRLTTKNNEAVFWSGIQNGSKIASDWVKRNGGSTLETTLSAKTLNYQTGIQEIHLLYQFGEKLPLILQLELEVT